MKIDTKTLRLACNRLFDHLEELGIVSIDIGEDYYWNISEECLYTMASQPKDFTVGQLTDDWLEIRAIADGERDAVSFGFVWLAAILRAIGEKVVR